MKEFLDFDSPYSQRLNTWLDQGFSHGFLGADIDVKESQEYFRNYIKDKYLVGGDCCFFLDQVHGREIVEVLSKDDFWEFKNADKLIKADGFLISPSVLQVEKSVFVIKTADCLPVILRSLDGGFVSLLHCGWRSVVAGIVPKAIDRMRELGAKNIQIAIGPSAQVETYEVKEDVVSVFENLNSKIKLEFKKSVIEEREDKYFLNLQAFVFNQIRELGVSKEDVFMSSINTMTDTRFCSYRRDRKASGRQCTYVVV